MVPDKRRDTKKVITIPRTMTPVKINVESIEPVSYTHLRIQNQFGAFCVRVLKNEARHIQRDLSLIHIYFLHIGLIGGASGVDPFGDLIDVPANGGQELVHLLNVPGIHINRCV